MPGSVVQPLKQRIQRDMLAAMRNRDASRASTLRMLYADFVRSEKSPSPADDVTVLQRYIQRLDAAIEEYRRLQQGSAGEMRERLQAAIDKERAELETIVTYLPEQYSDTELLQAIEETIAELKIASAAALHPGTVMKTLLARLDHSRVNKKTLAAMVSQRIKATPTAERERQERQEEQ